MGKTLTNQTELEEASKIIKILSNPTRLAALCMMLEEEISVTDLAQALGIEQTALSQHLKILKDNKLVQIRRQHRTLYYSTKDPKICKIIQTLKDIYCPTM